MNTKLWLQFGHCCGLYVHSNSLLYYLYSTQRCGTTGQSPDSSALQSVATLSARQLRISSWAGKPKLSTEMKESELLRHFLALTKATALTQALLVCVIEGLTTGHGSVMPSACGFR
jgi:hypothetical protein